MTYLIPSKISKSQVGRLAIVEVIEGDSLKVTARRSGILGPDGDRINVSYKVLSDGEDITDTEAPHLANVGEYLEENLSPFIKANKEIKSVTVDATIMMPGGKYLVPQPAIVVNSIYVERGDSDDGGPSQFYIPPAFMNEYAVRMGFIVPNMIPLPASLALALVSSDVKLAKKIRTKIKSLPSLWGKFDHKPAYKAVLTSYENDEDAGLNWKI